MSFVYDAGVFVAAERNDRDVWADHRARLELGLIPQTTAPVVAQVSRSPRQVQLRRMLRGCDIVGFAPDDSDEVGALMGKASTSDVVDAHVVVVASRRQATVLTADLEDLRPLASQVPTPVRIQRVTTDRAGAVAAPSRATAKRPEVLALLSLEDRAKLVAKLSAIGVAVDVDGMHGGSANDFFFLPADRESATGLTWHLPTIHNLAWHLYLLSWHPKGPGLCGR